MNKSGHEKSLSDHLNPILVREIRQMVRSRWIIGAILLYLACLVLFMGGMLIVHYDDSTQPDFGLFLFAMITGFTAGVTLLTVVVHTVARISFDRIHEDLSFYTSISPARHVGGRLICTIIISFMFFGMSFPFLSVTYYFRGVEPWHFVFIPVAFALIQIVNVLVLAVFAPVQTPWQLICYGALATGIAFILFMLGALYYEYVGMEVIREWGWIFDGFGLTPLQGLTYVVLPILLLTGFLLIPFAALLLIKRQMRKKGIPFSWRRWFFRSLVLMIEYVLLVFLLFASAQQFGLPVWLTLLKPNGIFAFWWILGSTAFLTLPVFLLVLVVLPVTGYLFAQCSMSPYSMNRMKPIRIWLTVLIALFSVVAIVFMVFFPEYRFGRWYRQTNVFSILVPAVVGTLSAMLVMAVCERETWEGRLRRDIPKSMLHRACVFPFYTGSINALTWIFLGTFFLIAMISLSIIFSSHNDIEQTMWVFPLMMLQMYVFNCSMAAFLIWKRYGQRLIHRQMIWMLTVTLFFGLFIAAVLLLETVLHLDSFLIGHILVGAVILWFLATIVFGYPWLRNRFLDFTPLTEEERQTASTNDATANRLS